MNTIKILLGEHRLSVSSIHPNQIGLESPSLIRDVLLQLMEKMSEGSTVTLEASSAVDHSEVYTALSHEYREIVIGHFQEVNEGLAVSDLASHIIDVKSLSTENDDGDLHRNVHGKLRHRHLPTLEKANLVRFDHEQNVAYPTRALQNLSF